MHSTGASESGPCALQRHTRAWSQAATIEVIGSKMDKIVVNGSFHIY